jgi:hypothetical protein
MRGAFLILLAAASLCGGCSAASAPATEPAAFRVENDGPSTIGPRVVSFGHVFARGELRPGATPRVTLGGADAPAQLDAKARWPDGSVRHGVLSVEIPALAPRRSQQGAVLPPDRGFSFALPAISGGPAAEPPPLTATLIFRDGPEAGRTAVFDVRKLALRPARRRAPWLNGALVREQRYWSPEVGGLQLAFDVWTPRRGPARVDVIFHSDLGRDAALGLRRYDVRLALGGREVFRADDVAQHAYSIWRKQVHVDGREPPRITPDAARLARLGATPAYLRVAPDPDTAQRLHVAATSDRRPLTPAGVTPYMPMTGGRADIGPLPTWAVIYLLNPDRKNLETLLANGDAAGSIPWHLRDPESDEPVSIGRRPEVWLDERGPTEPSVLPHGYRLPESGWTPDMAHQPSLSYLPYLLTGSQFHRDELATEAAYTLLSVDPDYRGGATGVILGQQVRQVAWTLRTLATAAWILPADDPLQAEFADILERNLQEITKRYVSGVQADGAGELEGFLPGPYAVDGAVAPWQNDYLAMVLGWLHGMGYAEAGPILQWMGNFTVGRFTSGPRGYAPIYGTPYFLYVADPATHAPLTRWAEAYKVTFQRAEPVTTLDYPDWGGGYAALARGALASIANTTGSPAARQAYAYVRSQTPAMDAAYAKDPTFAIALHNQETP